MLTTLYYIRRLTLHCVSLLHNSRIDLAYTAADHRVHHNSNNHKQYLLDEDLFDEQLQKKSSAANATRRTTINHDSTDLGLQPRSPFDQVHHRSMVVPPSTTTTLPNRVFTTAAILTDHRRTSNKEITTTRKQQQKTSSQYTPVGRRLQHFADNWHSVTNNFQILNILKHGFQIPFFQPPPYSTRRSQHYNRCSKSIIWDSHLTQQPCKPAFRRRN